MNDLNITTLISQIPYVSDVAQAHVAHPEIQQVLAADLAHQVLKDQNNQVQKVQTENESGAVSDKDKHQRERKRQEMQSRRKIKEPEPEPEISASNASPWLGHMLDRKV